MATRKDSKGQIVVVAKQFIAGMAKHLASTPQIVLLGSWFTPDQITSKLQQLVNLRADAEAAKAAAKIATERAQAPGSPRSSERVRVVREGDLRIFAGRPRRLRDCPEDARGAHGRDQGSGSREARGHARGTAHDGTEAEAGNRGERHRRPHDPDHCPVSRRDDTGTHRTDGPRDERGLDDRRADATHRISGACA